MSRERFIYGTIDGEVVVVYHEKNGEVLVNLREQQEIGRAPMVMADIKPYQSVIDGSVINSRSRHREHLRQHGCIEVGNERPKPRPKEIAPGLKQTVIDAYNQHKARR